MKVVCLPSPISVQHKTGHRCKLRPHQTGHLFEQLLTKTGHRADSNRQIQNAFDQFGVELGKRLAKELLAPNGVLTHNKTLDKSTNKLIFHTFPAQ